MPEAQRTIGADAMFVPSTIGGEDKVICAKGHLVSIDHRIGPRPFHDEADGAGRVAVCARHLTRVHHLQSGIDPAHSSRDIGAARVVEVDHPPPRLFRRHKVNRADHMIAQVLVAPDHGYGLRFRLPRFDLVGHGPKGTGVVFVQLIIIGQKLGRILDIGAANDIFPVVLARGGHGASPRCRILFGWQSGAVDFRRQYGFSKILQLQNTPPRAMLGVKGCPDDDACRKSL